MSGEQAAVAEALWIDPAEDIALTVALAQVGRGEAPTPNVAAVCIIALDRIRAALRVARAVQPTPPAQAEAVAALDEVERRLRQKPLDPEVQIVDPHLWAVSIVRGVRHTLLAPAAADQVAAMKDVADHAARQVADVEGRRE